MRRRDGMFGASRFVGAAALAALATGCAVGTTGPSREPDPADPAVRFMVAGNVAARPGVRGTAPGELGAPCTSDAQCASGVCAGLSESSGMCSARCDDTPDCVAGWRCGVDGGGEFSRRTCLCDSSPETCNALDDDCDGAIDEGIGDCCVEDTTRSCGSDVGACEFGTQTCLNGGVWSACVDAVGSAREICDGVDNDCDPATADGSAEPALGQACDGPDEDLCRIGSVACAAGVLGCAGDDTYDGCDRGCYSGGGTIADPYIIHVNEQVDRMYWCLNKHFALDADLDLGESCPRATRDYEGSTPGSLTGSVDGRGHTISRLSCVDESTYRGFLPIVGITGRVENLRIGDATVIACRFAGIVAGSNAGVIRNVTTTGTVRIGAGCLGHGGGGITGHNDGTIEECQTDVEIGTRNPSELLNSVGGIAGTCGVGSVIRRCGAVGSVSGATSVGGLIGWNTGSVDESFATGAVSGRSLVGGLVGNMGYPSAAIHDSFFEGSVSGSVIGGIVGSAHDGTIENVWISGSVSGPSLTGAVAGRTSWESTITNAFYDSTLALPAIGLGSGMTTGLTPAEMRMEASYGGALDFATVWTIDEGVDFPRLR